MSLSEMPGTTKFEKAEISSPEVSGDDFKLEVHFNPSSLKVARKRTWQDGDQFESEYPSLQWGKTSHDTLSFTLLFDHSEPRDLSDMAATAASLNPVMNLGPRRAKMMGLVNGDTVEHQLAVLYNLTNVWEVFSDVPDGRRPPLATFTWNNFAFTGAITTLTVEYILFDADGNPKRATAAIEMLGRLNWKGDIKVEKGKPLQPETPKKP
jgi:hypothetical protein